MTRKKLSVVAGILRDSHGRVLVAQRHSPKAYAGQWEFPGGKLEAGESPAEALVREFEEELGVAITVSAPRMRLCHEYPEFRVELWVREVIASHGDARAREGQPLAWVSVSELRDLPLLSADAPVPSMLELPSHYVFTPADMALNDVLDGLAALPEACLLRLRLPQLDDDTYGQVARQVIVASRQYGIRIMLDRDLAMAKALGAAGWHLRADAIESGSTDVRPDGLLVAASIHDQSELQAAQRIGADLVVIGAIRDTASHPGREPLGWAKCETLAEAAACPVYAIGGLAPADMSEANRHGALGIAGISAYWSGSDGRL